MARFWTSAVALAASLSANAAAQAQSTFHVKELEYKAGEWVFETINAYQGGFRPRSDRVQRGHEVGLGYAVTNWWLPKVLLSFDKEQDGGYEVQRLLFENVLTFNQPVEGKDGVSFAWFQSVEAALNSQQTNSTAFGPIFSAQAGKVSISTNTFFDKTFGQNREPGINFLFAWQARYEVMEKVKLGVEGYGFVPEIGASRPTPLTGMTHRIGPVLIFEFDLPGAATVSSHRSHGAPTMKRALGGPGHGKAEPGHAELEVGVLFGTTDYTPDVTGKVNMHISF